MKTLERQRLHSNAERWNDEKRETNMLAAILKGKAGRVSIDNENPQSWREIFRQREDLLTAVFFSRIRYLSEEGERKVMELLIGEESVKPLGAIKELIFWSKPVGWVELAKPITNPSKLWVSLRSTHPTMTQFIYYLV